MSGHDAVDNGHTKARALLFGGKEWLADLVGNFLSHPNAVVFDRNHCCGLSIVQRLLAAYGDSAFGAAGVDGVFEDVAHNLFNSMDVHFAAQVLRIIRID